MSQSSLSPGSSKKPNRLTSGTSAIPASDLIFDAEIYNAAYGSQVSNANPGPIEWRRRLQDETEGAFLEADLRDAESRFACLVMSYQALRDLSVSLGTRLPMDKDEYGSEGGRIGRLSTDLGWSAGILASIDPGWTTRSPRAQGDQDADSWFEKRLTSAVFPLVNPIHVQGMVKSLGLLSTCLEQESTREARRAALGCQALYQHQFGTTSQAPSYDVPKDSADIAKFKLQLRDAKDFLGRVLEPFKSEGSKEDTQTGIDVNSTEATVAGESTRVLWEQPIAPGNPEPSQPDPTPF